MHLIVRKRQPKSCWSRQDTNSPELCVNGTSRTFSTQERFILRIICASYYPAVPLLCLNLQQESRSPHMTPSAEVLSQPPSDQLTPSAEVLSQPPSDQLAQGPSIPGVPSHTLYSAALDNMKGTSASITLDNKNISNTSPRRAGTVRSKWTNDEVKVAERHVSLHKKLQSTR
ncbi:uncharacterized protein LOC112434354 [Maylandia zebra]|uniref:uncharacterized protein LOC112434354 n=1 Tax=Maylandia zebra TaxID=106582 RepID=UPI00403CB337